MNCCVDSVLSVLGFFCVQELVVWIMCLCIGNFVFGNFVLFC